MSRSPTERKSAPLALEPRSELRAVQRAPRPLTKTNPSERPQARNLREQETRSPMGEHCTVTDRGGQSVADQWEVGFHPCTITLMKGVPAPVALAVLRAPKLATSRLCAGFEAA